MKKSLIFLFFVAFTVATKAQDCEIILSSANNYYDSGKYLEASKMYQILAEKCGDNYGGCSAKLKDCNKKLQEDADYGKCNTIEGCNHYLKTYPNGRYVAEVKQKNAELKKAKELAQAKKEEKEAYEECTTIWACESYLSDYPQGRYVKQVEAKKKELEEMEEDLAYASCLTENDCDEYMSNYPNGRYYSEVKAKKERLAYERRNGAEKSAYMDIRKVSCANIDKSGKIINDYGSMLYASSLKYLKPKIYYNGILDESKWVTIYWKIIDPSGNLLRNKLSPKDYTWSDSFYVQPGTNKSRVLLGWGDSYVAGDYRLEIWYNDSKIYSTTFTVKK